MKRPVALRSSTTNQIDRRNFPRINFHSALKYFVNDATIRTLRSVQRQMEAVQQPGEKFDGIALFSDLEFLFTAFDHCLKHFVRRNVRFEISRIPQFPN